MRSYLKAKKYLELYIVADKALVSFGIIIFVFDQLHRSFPGYPNLYFWAPRGYSEPGWEMGFLKGI